MIGLRVVVTAAFVLLSFFGSGCAIFGGRGEAELEPHDAAHVVGSIALSSARREIAFATIGELEPVVGFLDLDDGTAVEPYPVGLDSLDRIVLLAASPDGALLAIASEAGRVEVIDGDRAPVAMLAVPGGGVELLEDSGSVRRGRRRLTVRDLAWAPDGQRLAVSVTRSDQAEVVILPRAGGAARVLHAGPYGGPRIAFSPDGSRLFAAGEDATLRAFDVASGELVWSAPTDWAAVRSHMTAIAVAPDGESLFVAGSDVWLAGHAAADGALLWKTALPGSGIDIGFAHGGAALAVLRERYVGAGDTKTVEASLVFVDPATGAVREGAVELDAEPIGLEVVPDGDRAVVAFGRFVQVVAVPATASD